MRSVVLLNGAAAVVMIGEVGESTSITWTGWVSIVRLGYESQFVGLRGLTSPKRIILATA